MEVDEVKICGICYLKFDNLELYEEHVARNEHIQNFPVEDSKETQIKTEINGEIPSVNVKVEPPDEGDLPEKLKKPADTHNIIKPSSRNNIQKAFNNLHLPGSADDNTNIELNVDPSKIHKTFSRTAKKQIPATQTSSVEEKVQVERDWIQQKFHNLHKCLVCNAKFPTTEALKKHLNYGDDPDQVFSELFVCQFCPEVFVLQTDFELHLKLLHPTEPPKNFRCNECRLDFFSSDELCEHDIRKHVPKSAWPHNCACGNSFVTPGELTCHSLEKQTESCLRGKISYCEICALDFQHPYFLERHKLYDHKKNSSFRCRKCRNFFSNFTDFEDHVIVCNPGPKERKKRVKQVEQDYSIECEYCGITFLVFERFLWHRKKYCFKTQESILLKCRSCSWGFPSLNLLVLHKRIHNKFQCKNCMGIFQDIKILLRHQQEECVDYFEEESEAGVSDEEESEMEEPEAEKSEIKKLKLEKPEMEESEANELEFLGILEVKKPQKTDDKPASILKPQIIKKIKARKPEVLTDLPEQKRTKLNPEMYGKTYGNRNKDSQQEPKTFPVVIEHRKLKIEETSVDKITLKPGQAVYQDDKEKVPGPKPGPALEIEKCYIEKIIKRVRIPSPPPNKTCINNLESDTNYNYVCLVCQERFQTPSEYLAHTGTEDFTLLNCGICFAFFDDAEMLEEHKRTSHPVGEKLKLPCNVCEESFMDKARILYHTQRMHTDSSDWPVSCRECGQKFINRMARSCHARLNDTCRFSGGNHCNICNYTFVSVDLFLKHVTHDHKENGNYDCCTCKKNFRSYRFLEAHQMEYQCKTCSMCFCRAETFRIHRSTHVRTKPIKFFCVDCKKMFQQSFATGMKVCRDADLVRCQDCQDVEKKEKVSEDMTNVKVGMFSCPKCSFTNAKVLDGKFDFSKRHSCQHCKEKVVLKYRPDLMDVRKEVDQEEEDEVDEEEEERECLNLKEESKDVQKCWKCYPCDAVFPTSKDLTTHIIKTHQIVRKVYVNSKKTM